MKISTPANIQTESIWSKFLQSVRHNIQSYILLVAVAVIWGIFFFLTNGRYLDPQNISNLFRQMSVTSFMSIGMVLVIVTGGIDLSVGKLAGFVSVVVAYLQFYVWFDLFPGQVVLPAILSVICGLLVGLLAGVVQGYIIAYLGLPAFIVTLGGMWLFNGLLLLVTQGKTIAANQPVFSDIGQGYVPPIWGWVIFGLIVVALIWNVFNSRRNKVKYGFTPRPLYLDLTSVGAILVLIFAYVLSVNNYKGIPVPVMLLAIVAVVIAYAANNTRFGRYAYAIGGNREAARFSGISVSSLVFRVFILMGGLCGVAGVVLASYVGYGTIAAGTGYELDAIAACILGGTSPLGGVGTIPGALIGALIIASLTTGLQMLNVQPAWQYVVKAIILVTAVYIDVYFKKHR
ncbi:MAG TPA: sugar ABC transporter permease [Anaerolineaceae bacterium]|nr:sugar ABC transporter permease [Anaerolineaceae bacterium]